MRNRFLQLLLVPALALGACDDRPLAPTAPEAAPVATRVGTTRDAGIRSDDSWLSASVTTTTDGVLTTEAQVEAGYGSAGELRFGMYWTPTIPSVALAGIRFVGDRVELVNAAGAIIGTNSYNGHMTEIGLPGASLAGAILQTQEPVESVCKPSDPDCLATLRADASAQASAAQSPDERRIRRRVTPARTTVALSGEGDYADVERVYRRVRQRNGAPDLWRLEEINEERRATFDHGPRVTRTQTRIRYTRYQMKAAREAERAASFRAAPAPASRASAVAPHAAATADAESALVPYAGEDADGLLDPFCVQGTRNDHTFRSKSALGGLSLIYQHGFCSDAAAFDGFRPRIANTIAVSRERAYSLNSTQSIEVQTTDLAQRVSEGGPSRSIVIGHSQGGLVARRFGQRNPEYVSGVVTIGTPQAGSLLAALGPNAIDELVTNLTAEKCASRILCQLVGAIVQEQLKGRLSVALLENGAPSLQEMMPESQFLLTLNSTYEPFARASVETSVGNRWAIVRMVGDAQSPVTGLLTGQRPAGDAWVTQAEYAYWSAQALRVFAGVALFYTEALGNGVNCAQSGYLTYWDPCANQTGFWNEGLDWFQAIAALATILVTSVVIDGMNAIDHAWDYATTRRQPGTDGLIHSYSQRYPNVPGAFVPERYVVDRPEADSHAGQLASPSTLQRTLDAVRSLSAKNP